MLLSPERRGSRGRLDGNPDPRSPEVLNWTQNINYASIHTVVTKPLVCDGTMEKLEDPIDHTETVSSWGT